MRSVSLYKTLTHEYPSYLDELVNEFIQGGWELQGIQYYANGKYTQAVIYRG